MFECVRGRECVCERECVFFVCGSVCVCEREREKEREEMNVCKKENNKTKTL